MAGDADLRLAPERIARFFHAAVGLAEMDPVGAQPLGQRDAVVDDEAAIAIGADPPQRLGERRGGVIVEPLHAELERGDLSAVERAGEPVGKGAADIERRDQVKLAGRQERRLGHRCSPIGAEPARQAFRNRSGATPDI